MKQWLFSEPVRTYLYGVLGPLLAVLAFYGVIDGNAVPVLVSLGGVVLGVPAVELARGKVTSPKTLAEIQEARGQ